MAWYQQKFNIKNIIFYKNKNKKISFPYKNKNTQKRKIYDFNLLFRKLIIKLDMNQNKKNDKNQQKLQINKRLSIIILIIISLIWICSGFYTIKESDKGIVLRFGKYNNVVSSGLNWKLTFIDKIIPVNVETVREQATNGMMLTSDENVIRVEMNVQYRVTDPIQYLFSVTDPDNSLRQALDSAVRGVIGQSAMEQVLTTNRAYIRDLTQKELEATISPYKMGITLLDVNFQAARPPEDVKAAFDDVIAAREEEQKTIREAHAYRNEVLPLAKGNAQRIIEEAEAYKASIVFKTEGEIESFIKILPEYRAAPKITRERLYIDTMEHILSNTRKIITNDKNSNILLFSLEQILSKNNNTKIKSSLNRITKDYKQSSYNTSQQINNYIRDDSTRIGR
ncbi:Modulator of FtsH protease HflK [Candidatus Providencia siddallii]|uniref:Protein HflK n=1 Tax=Candidatus Providencia siddallii TaxID=1715285 RepID=A0A0M6W6Z8_9GAMM|nr:Modulator of FtsH protease HflK [Candidatus Providencia siddallii]